MLTVADILARTGSSSGRGRGPAACTHPVRWVHTSELDDPTPWLRAASCC